MFQVRQSLVLVAGLTAVLSPLTALAQTSSVYVPPKLLQRGTNVTPSAGQGKVTLKVRLKADGSVADVIVVSSTNPADNRAAIEVAKASKFKPATRDGKPEIAFYTLALTFTATTIVDPTDADSNDKLRAANALIRAGNYNGAKAQLTDYLKANPSDAKANLLLGVADSFIGASSEAAAAFDKAGTIPPIYKEVAGRSYALAAGEAMKAGDNDAAIALATKSIDLIASTGAYNARGTAEFTAKKYEDAIADLEKAASLASTSNPPADAHQQAIIMANLGSAYAAAGHIDKATEMAKDVQRLDPSITVVQDGIAQYYLDQAQTDVKAEDRAAAVAQLEIGAAAAPKDALIFYTQATVVLANAKMPDWKKVRAEADKALALAPNDARSNYLAGLAIVNSGGSKADALTYLKRAQTAASAGTDAKLTQQINDAIKQLNPNAANADPQLAHPSGNSKY
jgi:TonB family protein